MKFDPKRKLNHKNVTDERKSFRGMMSLGAAGSRYSTHAPGMARFNTESDAYKGPAKDRPKWLEEEARQAGLSKAAKQRLNKRRNITER